VSGLEIFFGVLFCLGAFFFMYMTSHIEEEYRQGKYIPTFWEKK